MNYETEYYAVERTERDAERAYETVLSQMEEEAKRKIRLFMSQSDLAKNMRELQAERAAAHTRMVEQKERRALAGDQAPYPLGTKLTKTTGNRSWHQKTHFGILEAVTRETEFPGNMGRWYRPTVGNYIVRFLKNDGTPSKRIDTGYASWTAVDPEVEKQAAEKRAARANAIKV